MKNNYDNKRRSKPNVLEVPLFINDEMEEEIQDAILDVLKSTPFNKISFPISVYRHSIDPNVASDDTRLVTVGYIRNYNDETNVFTVVLFAKLCDTVKASFKQPTIVTYNTEHNGKFGAITKMVIENALTTAEDQPE